MRNYIFALAVVSLFLTGCGKARESQEGAESLNTETLNVSEADALLGASAPAQPAKPETPVANIVVNNESGPLLEQPAAPAVSTETPDSMMIQQALKNAGLYQGAIDGKIGPRSKEAIKDFQRKNDLVADGKVGPKTWALLKTYLDQPAASSQAPSN